MATNMKLAEKGRNEPLVGLRDQAKYQWLLQSDEQKGNVLLLNGWTLVDRTAFGGGITILSSETAEHSVGKDVSKQRTQAEQKAISAFKLFKQKFDPNVRDVFLTAAVEGTTLPVGADAFETGALGVLGRVTPRISSYLENIKPHVAKIDDLLKPYFGGKSVVTLVDELRSNLDGAQAIQEVGLTGLPADTLQVYEAMGRVLFYIEKVNRVGIGAYAGDAVTAAMFNKDLLLRARAAQKEAGEGKVGGAPT